MVERAGERALEEEKVLAMCAHTAENLSDTCARMNEPAFDESANDSPRWYPEMSKNKVDE